jgi:hypothetical protein
MEFATAPPEKQKEEYFKYVEMQRQMAPNLFYDPRGGYVGGISQPSMDTRTRGGVSVPSLLGVKVR